ncbi:MAG: M20/M25/M40 family metallo-hydrolase [Bryobacteraceae bacterium]|nr:M20/M25/M40 family metallo-hydrolase [Bryobacterales bacterium]MEB2362846.1 M20/M25/M40 family metallo-hydrolase [Bryobacterales bacterium]NUN00180.1 M20/M25/M40 family metallo-hydrolase [Bryobacteraceae bacterium]
MTTDISLSELREAVASVRDDAQQFLCELIRVPSLPGKEADAIACAEKWFAGKAEVERAPLSNSLRQDEDYADPVPGIEYDGRWNLRVRVPGSGGGRSLLFNTHLDVVPASEGQSRPFDPVVDNGIVRGRGACDAKGQAAAIFAVIAALHRLGVRLNGDLLAHLVVEEEVGGNGTLAMIRKGEQADACIVMEPTDQRILSSVRGAVWFRVICTGKPGHSGSAGSTVSALKMAVRVMEILEGYHARLLASSRGIAMFDDYPNPMPITFGKLNAGNWPASAPAEAVIEGVLGLLPNKTRYEVMEEMRQAIASGADEWLREHFRLEFMYRHDAHVLDPSHPLAAGLSTACREAGLAGDIGAMTASCDSWFYNNQLKIPSVVFGPGSLSVAHSREEHIHMDDICSAAVALLNFARNWCGRSEP